MSRKAAWAWTLIYVFSSFPRKFWIIQISHLLCPSYCCIQYDRLLAWYCCPSVCRSVTLCIAANQCILQQECLQWPHPLRLPTPKMWSIYCLLQIWLSGVVFVDITVQPFSWDNVLQLSTLYMKAVRSAFSATAGLLSINVVAFLSVAISSCRSWHYRKEADKKIQRSIRWWQGVLTMRKLLERKLKKHRWHWTEAENEECQKSE